MASRYAHGETFALRDGRFPQHGKVSAGSIKWKGVAAVTGAVLSLGLVGSALHAQTPATLDLVASQLRGAAVEPLTLPPGLDASHGVLSGEVNGRPVVMGEPGPVILPPTQGEEAKRPFEEVPRPWEVISDPQPGPPPGMDSVVELSQGSPSEGAISSRAESPSTTGQPSAGSSQSDLKDMLLQAFGIDGSTAKEDEAVTTAAEENPSPVEQAEVAEAKKELREALLSQLGPQYEKQGEPTTGGNEDVELNVVVGSDAVSWNWLHPPEETYAQLKREQGDVISVATVYEHLQKERDARRQKLQEEMQQTEREYRRTVDCFYRGIPEDKAVLPRDEYNSLVQWMNAKCMKEGDAVGSGEDSKSAQHKTFMTKAEFKAAITQRFQPALEAFRQGKLSAKEAVAQAQAVKQKIASCIDRATENAATERRIHKSKLEAALGWIINRCVDLP